MVLISSSEDEKFNLIAAIFDFSAKNDVSNPNNGRNGFSDPKNLSIDTKIAFIHSYLDQTLRYSQFSIMAVILAAILIISKCSRRTKWYHPDLESAGQYCPETIKTSCARSYGPGPGL